MLKQDTLCVHVFLKMAKLIPADSWTALNEEEKIRVVVFLARKITNEISSGIGLEIMPETRIERWLEILSLSTIQAILPMCHLCRSRSCTFSQKKKKPVDKKNRLCHLRAVWLPLCSRSVFCLLDFMLRSVDFRLLFMNLCAVVAVAVA